MSVKKGFSLLLHCGITYNKIKCQNKLPIVIPSYLISSKKTIYRDIFPLSRRPGLTADSFSTTLSGTLLPDKSMFLLLLFLLPFPLSTALHLFFFLFTEKTFPLLELFKCLSSFLLVLKTYAFEEKPTLSLCAHMYFPKKILTQHTQGTFAL